MRDELIGFLEKRKISSLPKSDGNTHVTCVHIRRGDFKTYGQAPSDSDFVKKAIKFIERKEKLKRIERFHISQNSPSDDLIYSRDNCDVVFVSAAKSTFGWWIGYFSKGNRVYYTDIKMTNDKTYRLGHLLEMDYYMPHWTRIRFSEDKETVIEN
uniref:OTU domain-containing protein n=1 Tax=Caenorhabditis tropicalis TaxID=1561998 RepID=A0A1I7T7N3_9PELO